MKTGLLWYDDDPKLTLQKRIARACARYTQKWGQKPDWCYINPTQMLDNVQKVSPVRVEARTNVLLNHYWVGKETVP